MEPPVIILRVPGSPPAKANQYRWTGKGRPRFIKQRQVHAYEDLIAMQARSLLAQLGLPVPLYTVPVMVSVTYHQGNLRRRDIDNIAKPVADGLAAGGVFADDRLVDVLLIQRYYDAPGRAGEWTEIVVAPYDTSEQPASPAHV
jgi:Holliday junction resolvase RusA-like endonuclease